MGTTTSNSTKKNHTTLDRQPSYEIVCSKCCQPIEDQQNIQIVSNSNSNLGLVESVGNSSHQLKMLKNSQEITLRNNSARPSAPNRERASLSKRRTTSNVEHAS